MDHWATAPGTRYMFSSNKYLEAFAHPAVDPPQRNLLFTVLSSTGNIKNGKRSSRTSVSEYRREMASMVFVRELLFEIFKI